jgi:DNA-binding transcriptional MerR regulator
MESNAHDAAEKPGRLQSHAKRKDPKRKPTGHLAVGEREARAPGARQVHPSKRAAAEKVAAQTKLRAAEAVRLRAAGFTLQQIAQKIGHADKSSVSRLIKRELAATPVEDIDTLRTLEHEKLARLERKLNQILESADSETREKLDAIGKAIALSGARRKLFGLDAPLRTEVTGKNGGPIELDELAAAEDRVERRLAALRDGVGEPAGEPGGVGTPAAGPVGCGVGDEPLAEGEGPGASTDCANTP